MMLPKTLPTTITMHMEAYVNDVFKEVKDKSGNPYVSHLDSVRSRCYDLSSFWHHTEIDKNLLIVLAFSHDLKEDFPKEYSLFYDKFKQHVPEQFWISLDLVTRKKENTYSEFIDIICQSGDLYAIIVKLADNLDNNDPRRLVRLSKDERTITKRYDKANKKLREAYFKLYDEFSWKTG